MSSHHTKEDGQPPPAMADLESGDRARHMGLISGGALVAGFVIGSGIFAPGEMFKLIDTPAQVLLIWVAGGLLAACGAMGYAELGSMYTASGGDQIYLSEAFHPAAGMGFSMNANLAAMPIVEASITSIFVSYLYRLVTWDMDKGVADQPRTDPSSFKLRAIGAATIFVIAGLNMIHRKAGSALQTFFTAGKLAAMLFVVVLGVVWVCQGKTTPPLRRPFESTAPGQPADITNYTKAFVYALFSYAGFNNLNAATGELKNPRRNLPLAIGIALGVVIVFYALINVSYMAVLTTDVITAGNAIAMLVGAEVLGFAGACLTAIGVMLSAFGASNGACIGHSRLIMAAAEENSWMPKVFSKVSSRGTPVYALLLNAVISVAIMLCFPDFTALATASVFSLFSHYIASNLALVRLRWKRPDAPRPFKAPIALPILFVIVCTAINGMILVEAVTSFANGAEGSAALVACFAVLFAISFVLPGVVCYFRPPRPRANQADKCVE